MQSYVSIDEIIVSNNTVLNKNESKCKLYVQVSLGPEGAQEHGSDSCWLSSPLSLSNWADNAPHCPATRLTLRV